MSHQVNLPGDSQPQGALQAADGRSLGEVMGDLTKDVSTLMQQEVALAKAELRQSGQKAGKGIGLLAGAAVAGLLILVFISLSAMWGLGGYIGQEWSSLVVAIVWVIIAIILAKAGQAEMKRIQGIPQTTDTLGKVPNALKGQEELNR
jgi:tetrahydromethanopterin S-methyltransferase subunit G